jgi:class 3 adenylate cyclase
VTANYGGTYVKSTGDGALLVFDSPSRAIRCLQELRGRVQGLGIDIRAGLHAGEIELLHGGNDLGGLAVHAAARIASVANDGEVLVSRTVLDLLEGSGVMLSDRGEHELRGLQRPMELYAVT